MGSGHATVERDWKMARAWLRRKLRMIAFAIKTRELLTRPRVNSWTLNYRRR
jgi:hypothetical protein